MILCLRNGKSRKFSKFYLFLDGWALFRTIAKVLNAFLSKCQFFFLIVKFSFWWWLWGRWCRKSADVSGNGSWSLAWGLVARITRRLRCVYSSERFWGCRRSNWQRYKFLISQLIWMWHNLEQPTQPWMLRIYFFLTVNEFLEELPRSAAVREYK